MKNLKVIFMTLAAALIVGSAAAQQTFDDAEAKYKAGVEKVNAKDYEGAVKLLKEAMDIAIDLEEVGAPMVKEIKGLIPGVYLRAGATYAQSKAFDKAIENLSQASNVADLYGDVKTSRQASRMMSNVYMAMGIDSFNNKEYQKALDVFTKGRESDPQNIRLSNFIAKCYGELGDLENSGKIYKEIIDAAAANTKFKADGDAAIEDITTYTLVAMSAAGQENDLEKMVELARSFDSIVPNQPVANLMVVQLANNLKKYDTVIEFGDKAAEAQTEAAKKSEAYFLLGIAYQNKENKAKAIEAYRKVTEGPNAAVARTSIADLSK